jgi:hypothetical protein
MSQAVAMAGAAGTGRSLRPYALGVIAALGIILVAQAVQLLLWSVWAVRYPYELDYGEGIVWQQMRLMFTERAYGPILGFPAIVFHYPPVYHVTTLGLADAARIDQLAAGRIVSLAGLVTILCMIAALTFRVARREMARPTALACSAVAALILLSSWPVLFWTPVMRVDFLAVAFSLAGLFFSVRALERSWLVHVAALLFVLAVYTKQSTIAAPAAAFAVLLFLRPRVGLAGMISSVAMGFSAMGVLWWATDGGFTRHLFLYNINRFEAQYLLRIVETVGTHAAYVGIAGIAARDRIAALLADYRNTSRSELRRRILETKGGETALILLAYLAVTTLMLPLLAKSGSSYNYLIEWICALSIFVGLGLRDVVDLAARGSAPKPAAVSSLQLILAAALIAQISMLPKHRYERLPPLPDRKELAELSRMIAAAPKPVIADDMVLLLRSGREVAWESAIFAELASIGKFDERPFIGKIRSRDFSFFVTNGERGDPTFDSRYNPEVADALDDAYPRREYLAGMVVRLPES